MYARQKKTRWERPITEAEMERLGSNASRGGEREGGVRRQAAWEQSDEPREKLPRSELGNSNVRGSTRDRSTDSRDSARYEQRSQNESQRDTWRLSNQDHWLRTNEPANSNVGYASVMKRVMETVVAKNPGGPPVVAPRDAEMPVDNGRPREERSRPREEPTLPSKGLTVAEREKMGRIKNELDRMKREDKEAYDMLVAVVLASQEACNLRETMQGKTSLRRSPSPPKLMKGSLNDGSVAALSADGCRKLGEGIPMSHPSKVKASSPSRGVKESDKKAPPSLFSAPALLQNNRTESWRNSSSSERVDRSDPWPRPPAPAGESWRTGAKEMSNPISWRDANKEMKSATDLMAHFRSNNKLIMLLVPINAEEHPFGGSPLGPPMPFRHIDDGRYGGPPPPHVRYNETFERPSPMNDRGSFPRRGDFGPFRR